MNILNLAILTTALLLIITGLYMLFRTHNMIRIILAIEIVVKAVTLILAFAGYVTGKYALVQAFIITMIVIEVVVAVVAAGIAVNVYKNNGNMDVSKLKRLKG